MINKEDKYGILKISVSKFEFANYLLVETFKDIETAKHFIASDKDYSVRHGNGWNDSYFYKLVKIKNGKYFHLNGKPFNPTLGKTVV